MIISFLKSSISSFVIKYYSFFVLPHFKETQRLHDRDFDVKICKWANFYQMKEKTVTCSISKVKTSITLWKTENKNDAHFMKMKINAEKTSDVQHRK